MTAADLLPSNASQLERDLSRAGDVLPKLGPGAERIRTAKRADIPDDVVPWLIYEYGLGEITPYVPDLRQALAEGIQWQRVRGTRRAIDIGLGWIGFDATVEESEAGTLRWADFQMGLDQAPNGLEFTNNVIQISRLSAPIRSRLFRIYGGYDYRRFRLDDHLLSGGSWLADDTGVYLREDWPQLSFGREYETLGDLAAGQALASGIEHNYTDGGQYEDRMILSCSQLDELLWRTWHIENARVVVSRGHLTVVGPWWLPPTSWTQATWDQGLDWAGIVNRIAPPLQFAKAGLCLSDGAVLGDTNACFPARYREEVGFGAVQLSEADPATGEGVLSEHVARFDFTEWNERLERQTAAVGVAAADAASTVTISREHQRLLPYDDVFRLDHHLIGEWQQLANEQAITRDHTTAALGQNITALSWEPLTWLQTNQWLTNPIRESQLARTHTTEIVEDRQAIAEASRSGLRTIQVDLTLFGSWLTREDWSGYWNESVPLIESQHQSTT
jgi:hypothetical protein